MNHRQKHTLLRILVSALLLLAATLAPTIWLPAGIPFFSVSRVAQDGSAAFVLSRAALYLIPYAVIGWDVLWRAVRNIAHGQVFDENFLMSIATVGAFVTGEYPEAVFVMLFYQVGELFQSCAVGKSRRSIAALMDIRPEYANWEQDGAVRQADPEEVPVGAVIMVKPGERIPLDGVVVEGSSTLDTAALTGESLPRRAAPGDEVISGCINQTGVLRVRVTKAYGQSTVARILDLVENAGSRKAKAEHFITRFARYYTPAVVFAALALAILPGLATGNWGEWIHRALIFLVISCPCALVISVPLSFFGGIGGASRAGILVKGGNYLEALANTQVVVFDKTGTLTQGVFRVTGVRPGRGSREELLELAALAESWSDHPIARSIQEAWGRPVDRERVSGAEELPGRGVRCLVDGTPVYAGNEKLMAECGVAAPPCDQAGTVVHVARGGVYTGCLVIADEVKPDARAAVSALRAAGVGKIVMLTGDADEVGRAVGAELGLDEVHTRLLPSDKVDQVERLLGQTPAGGTLAFVGDGINDAPVLSRADVGIAMGALGSDAAIEAADIVLMDDKPSKVADAIAIARKTRRIVRQNIIFALSVKALVLVLGALGAASMWAAVFADVGVSVIAVLNAMRTLRTVSRPAPAAPPSPYAGEDAGVSKTF